jgi:hypothetical protein
MLERTQFVLESRSLWHLFVAAYTEIYVFRGKPFRALILEKSYQKTQPFKQEKINTKTKIKV